MCRHAAAEAHAQAVRIKGAKRERRERQARLRDGVPPPPPPPPAKVAHLLRAIERHQRAIIAAGEARFDERDAPILAAKHEADRQLWAELEQQWS